MSSFFYGYLTTQFLGGYLAVKFGGTNIFAIGIGVTALLTVFTPLLVKANVYLLLVVRIVEGIFEVSKLILFTTRHCIIYLLLMYS